MEEEIKRLDHHYNKASKEIEELKVQLAVTEEQNEVLQMDVVNYRTKLTK